MIIFLRKLSVRFEKTATVYATNSYLLNNALSYFKWSKYKQIVSGRWLVS